jgi:hypothetical protein
VPWVRTQSQQLLNRLELSLLSRPRQWPISISVDAVKVGTPLKELGDDVGVAAMRGIVQHEMRRGERVDEALWAWCFWTGAAAQTPGQLLFGSREGSTGEPGTWGPVDGFDGAKELRVRHEGKVLDGASV